MSDRQTWTKEKIKEELSRTSFGYQNISLPHGLSTGGDDRSPTADAIFRERVDGKSIFDLGSRFGFFCFLAEERGAARVVGAEIESEYVRKSRLLAEMRGSNAEYILFDIERERIPEKFDIVLCLNVLHHLRNPLSALDNLIGATKERLVIETAGFTRRDRRKNGIWFWMVPLLSRLPILLIARNSAQTFFLTVAALKVLLLEKRADVAFLETIYAGHKGRPIVVAHRRRIKRLLVVAGLPAAGKSTLIDHLLDGKNAETARLIGFDSTLAWRAINFNSIKENKDPDMGNVIVHYNISGRLMNSDIYKYDNALPELMSVADEVSIVTLACPRNRLRAQFKQGRLPKGQGFLARKSASKKLKKLSELYENDAALNATYDKWFATLSHWGKMHAVIKHDGVGYSVEKTNSLKNY